VFDEVMTLPEIFERAGCRGFVHATRVDGRREVGLLPDAPVVPASVVKVLVALEAETRMADGRLDPVQRVRVSALPGPVGFSLFQDHVELSVRDLVVIMLTISDNVATDALLDLVGLDAVNATASRLGLDATRLGTNLRDLVDSIAQDAGFDSWKAFQGWVAGEPGPEELSAAQAGIRAAAALRPDAATRTTARDMTRLLQAVWTDRAGPPQACARVRDLMARQVTRNRVAAGFGLGVSVAAKSGGLMGVVRNEVAVVTFPEEPPYAVAVFTRTDGPHVDERAVNAAIGVAAAHAVSDLREAD
jgi:beta-lactamase class A